MSVESTCILAVATVVFLVFGLLNHSIPKYIAKAAVGAYVFTTTASQRELTHEWRKLSDAIRKSDDNDLLPVDLLIVKLSLMITANGTVGKGADVSLLHDLREAVLFKMRQVNQSTMPYCKAKDIATWIDLAL